MNAWALAADLLVVVHLGFVLFVVLGGLPVLRWPRLAWVHLPVALYGLLIEWIGWICPLTPLENELRRRAGEAGYAGGFVEHYLLPVLYPAGLTREVQWVLGGLVLGINLTVYGVVLARRRRARLAPTSRPPGGSTRSPSSSPTSAGRAGTVDRAGDEAID